MSKIETFIDLFDLLKSLHQDEFLIWLTTPWKGKDKQESVLIEHLRLDKNLGIKETKVIWDPKFWNHVQKRLIDFADFYHKFCKNRTLQE